MPKRGEYSASASKRSKQQRAYNSKPGSKKDRASRNAARSKMGAKGSGKDVDHKNRNPNDNARGNLRVQSKSSNRSRNSLLGRRKSILGG